MDIQDIIQKLKDEAEYTDLMIMSDYQSLENERYKGVQEGLNRAVLIIKAQIKNGKERE